MIKEIKFSIIKYFLFLITLLSITSVACSQVSDSRIFDDSQMKVAEIGTNSVHSDFGPAIVNDSIYFTTFNDKLAVKSDEILRKKEFYDLFKAAIDNQGNTTGKRIPVTEFITRYNDGPVSWCEKTGELFVTQNYDDQSVELKPFRNVLSRLRIYIAKKIDNNWVEITDFPFNSPDFSVGHPAITETGDTLVFSSDKAGGNGETDLYYSIRIKNIWQYPVNLGPKINTPGKDEFPFFTGQTVNGRFLIFSSKGRPGSGGFDLYYTKFPSDSIEINHFNSPINSEYDDFAMTIPASREYGYFTSNRPGTGSDDIYKFTFKKIPNKPIKQPIKILRELYAYDFNSRHPIPGVNVVSCNEKNYITDVTGKIDSIQCSDGNCKVIANAFGYNEKTKVLAACKKNIEVTRDTIWMNIIENQKILLKNIYYDYDKWNILPEAATELDRLVSLMKENPGMRVDLGSHTDERGSEKYNLKLSQLRANSAIDYVVSQGIELSRIKGEGFGKTQLLHKSTEEKKCTPEQDRENRRTEIFIPGFLRSEPVRQDKGDYSDGKPDHSKDYSSFKEHGSIFQKDAKVDAIEKMDSQYYLMLNSFKYRLNASEFVLDLKSDGYKAMVIGDYEPFRVGIAFKYFSQAKEMLEFLKPKYKGMWIWYK